MFTPKLTIAVTALLLLGLPEATGARTELASRAAQPIAKKSDGQHQLTMTAEVDDPVVYWPTSYAIQQTGMITTSYDCFGNYGMGWDQLWGGLVPGWPLASFETPSGTDREYLFAGATWVGGIVGTDTLVSTGADGWSSSSNEYRPPNYPEGSITRFAYPADYSMRAVYTDTCEYYDPICWDQRPHIPLNIQVSNRSHVWRTVDYEDIVIFDFVLTNIGTQLIERAYVGHYADADVGWTHLYDIHTDDLTGSLRDHGIGYVIDNDGDPDGENYDPITSARKIYAYRLLASSHPVADTNFNWWISNGTSARDFGPRLIGTAEDPFFDFGTGGIGTPEGDVNKYYVLSHREWDYDQAYTATIPPDDPLWLTPPDENFIRDYSDGSDARFLMSFGPFDIEPGASIRLLLAAFTADNVHQFPLSAYLFLPDMPDDYVDHLDFADVLVNSSRADELAAILLNPLLPVVGLSVAQQEPDSAVLTWDPWVFDNIDGHEVFLSEIPSGDIPYPGVVPPWVTAEIPDHASSIGVESYYVFDKPQPGSVYFAKVAHQASGETGDTGEPALLDYRQRTAPQFESDFSVFSATESASASKGCSSVATLRWSQPQGTSVEQYNIYRFDNPDELAGRYYPFYDQGEYKDIIIPADTLEIGGKTYYFYMMEPYAVVDRGVHEFSDSEPLDGASYIITAVDKYGCESYFSEPTFAYEISCFDKDILVLTNLGAGWAAPDSIRVFYEDILDGYNYDIYNYQDTIYKYSCSNDPAECVRWQDFTRYKLLLLEEDSWHPILTEAFESSSHSVTNYLSSGGRLAYFGGFEGFGYHTPSEAVYYPADYEFINRFFGIDSVFYYGITCYGYSTPKLDTTYGFMEAESVLPAWPGVYFDQSRNPFGNIINYVWGSETPPAVATFAVNDRGIITHVYRSLYPETTILDGAPVGVKTTTGDIRTFLYGFHLWYMQRESSRELVEAIFRGVGGNSDGKPGSSVPEELSLKQNYPNPFNPWTVISLELPQAAEISLEIFNILGQRVKTLVSGQQLEAGFHRFEWHGDDASGNKVSSGIYLYRLRAGDQQTTRKMMLLK